MMKHIVEFFNDFVFFFACVLKGQNPYGKRKRKRKNSNLVVVDKIVVDELVADGLLTFEDAKRITGNYAGTTKK